jgi:hypothetical protein
MVRNQTLNKFVERAYRKEPGDRSDHRIAFVSKLSHPFTDGLAKCPLVSSPTLPEALLGAKPSDYDAIVRSCFMDESLNPRLDRYGFIILDEFTETDETVLVAMNYANDGQLILLRTNFETSTICLVTTVNTGLSVEEQAEAATQVPLGVWRGDSLPY